MTRIKKDKAHPGQTEFTHWMNCINDSSAIIRRYGLTPTIKARETVKKMIPDLLVFSDHFETKNKARTKYECAALASNMFGRKASYVSCATSRVIGVSKFYNKARTMIAYLKLFAGYAIKKKNKKTAPFLSGGVYAGYKNEGPVIRDSLFLKDKEDKEKVRKVTDFR